MTEPWNNIFNQPPPTSSFWSSFSSVLSVTGSSLSFRSDQFPRWSFSLSAATAQKTNKSKNTPKQVWFRKVLKVSSRQKPGPTGTMIHSSTHTHTHTVLRLGASWCVSAVSSPTPPTHTHTTHFVTGGGGGGGVIRQIDRSQSQNS